MKKANHFLAVYVGPDREKRERAMVRMWDMLRYDGCYPVTVNMPDAGDFIVLRQDYMKDRAMGFTTARWESMGFRDYIAATSETISLSYAMVEDMKAMAQFKVQQGEKRVPA
jgi:hypothetical protein